MKYNLSTNEQKNYSLFNDNDFIKKILDNVPSEMIKFLDEIRELKIFPVFVSDNFFKIKNNNIHFIGDAFFAFPPSFAQGASQSIEDAYQLFKSIENNTEDSFFKNRVSKTKMVNNRSKINLFAFHLSSPFTTFLRDILHSQVDTTYYTRKCIINHNNVNPITFYTYKQGRSHTHHISKDAATK